MGSCGHFATAGKHILNDCIPEVNFGTVSTVICSSTPQLELNKAIIWVGVVIVWVVNINKKS